jgi:hypothetical protein
MHQEGILLYEPIIDPPQQLNALLYRVCALELHSKRGGAIAQKIGTQMAQKAALVFRLHNQSGNLEYHPLIPFAYTDT